MHRSQPHDRIVLPGDDSICAQVRAYWPGEVPALYVRGPFPLQQPAIAIIGTTEPDPLARVWAFASARAAAKAGWLVVSGLARGIDRAAHEGALAGGGRTAAVVANGLDLVYPPGSEDLLNRLLAADGTVISISPAGTVATREGLLLRNQFTSAFADIVLAVQAHGRGGTIATMRHAARQRKLLATFTPPPDSDADEWSGNSLLLGAESPWRDRSIRWQPAFQLADPSALPELFAHWQSRPPVDAPETLRDTQKPEQPRLLEERATYDEEE